MTTKTWNIIKTDEMNDCTFSAANQTLTWIEDGTYTDFGIPEVWQAFLELAGLTEVTK